jgi:hypothetical protein
MEPAQTPTRSQSASTFGDGFGRRQQVVTGTKDPIEVLVLKRELLAVAGFEAAVRERIEQVGRFRHDSFTRIRGLARLAKDNAGLVLVSDLVEGKRLAQLLDSDQHTLDTSGALMLVGQLMDALSMFHQIVPGGHGAIGPERLIVKADGRLVVADHVFGNALPKLSLDAGSFWQQLQITVPTSGPVFDQQTDILQAGAVALALLLGRPLGAGYPSRIGSKTGTTALSISAALELVPADVASWISRAIRRPGHAPFTSSADAREAFAGVLVNINRVAARQAVLAFYSGASVAERTPARPTAVPGPGVASVATSERPSVSAAPAAVVAETPVQASINATKSDAVEAAAAQTDAMLGDDPDSDFAEEHTTIAAAASAYVSPLRRFFVPMTRRTIAVAAGVLMLLTTGGAFAAKRYFSPTQPVVPGKGTLAVTTNPAGANVVIDGQQRGQAPMTLELVAGDHVLQVGLNGSSRTVPFKVTPGAEVSQVIDLPKIVAPNGQLQVRTEPSGAKVIVDGQKRGTSPVKIDNLTPGTHNVTIESQAGSVTQDVTIESGVTASLVVPLGAPAAAAAPVSGWIAITAPIDVQIFENGQLLGTNRSEKIMASVGRHELNISNDSLGYRVTRSITVAAGQVSSMRIDPPKGSISLNAVPWAEVWIDGERVGETPIGNFAITLGSHEVVFRHPDLGEQRFMSTVTLNAPARVTADLRRKP